MNKFFEELKRRNVIKSTLAYLVVVWVLLQVFQMLLPMVDAPDWTLKGITIIMAIGLPIWIIVSWVYDITAQGIEKTTKDSENEIVTQATSKRLNTFIIVSLSIAVIVMGLKLSNVFSASDKQYAIAILPFDNIQVDEGNEWLSAGFTQDVNSYISKVSNLRVTDSHSTRKYKDSDKTNTEIAKELDVSYILRGTLRQLKDKLNITVELIDAISNRVVWSENYEEIFEDDALNIQQQVSQKIVEQLKIKLTPEDEKSLKKFPTKNKEAYKLFIKGQDLADTRTRENLEKALKLYQQAVILDTSYAEAYAEIGHMYYFLGREGAINIQKADKKIKEYSDKALSINPNISRAYSILALRLFLSSDSLDLDKMRMYFEKAIEINPNDAMAYEQLATFYIKIYDIEKSMTLITEAQRLDPLSGRINFAYCLNLALIGKFEEAEEHYNKTKYLFDDIRENISFSYIIQERAKKISIEKKDWNEAIKFYHKEIKKDSTKSYLFSELGSAYDLILNDDINYLKYTKKAYSKDSTNFREAMSYCYALIENKKFKEAKILMNTNNFKSLFTERKTLELYILFYYHYYKKNYKKTQEILIDDMFNRAYQEKLLHLAQIGKVKEVYQLFKRQEISNSDKAFAFAILKEKDSMYNYLMKSSIDDAQMINSRFEFDPYRKEERYKEFLRKKLFTHYAFE